MCTRAFVELSKTTAAKRGMPLEPIVFTPHPVWGKTPAELAAMVGGSDPVTGKSMMKEVMDYLTTPLSEEEKKTGIENVSLGPSVDGPDTLDNLQEIFMNNGMTDYMPMIIPTEEKVEAMLKGTSHHPDEVLKKAIQGVGYESAQWG